MLEKGYVVNTKLIISHFLILDFQLDPKEMTGSFQGNNKYLKIFLFSTLQLHVQIRSIPLIFQWIDDVNNITMTTFGLLLGNVKCGTINVLLKKGHKKMNCL